MEASASDLAPVANGHAHPLPPEEAAVSLVRREHLPAMWGRVAAWVAEALEASVAYEVTPGMLYARLEQGRAALLLAHCGNTLLGCAVMSVNEDERGARWCSLSACGGTVLEAWLPLMVRAIKQMAREAKAERIVIVGRRGWARLLEADAVHLHSVVLECTDLRG